jgi:hypothetical protein
MQNIVDRAKKKAVKRRHPRERASGLRLLDSVREEFKENEDLRDHPDDWARISGRGERIINVHALTPA